jgi:hypothetical protein
MKKRMRTGWLMTGLLSLAGCMATEGTNGNPEPAAVEVAVPAATETAAAPQTAEQPAPSEEAIPSEEVVLAQAPAQPDRAKPNEPERPQGKRLALLIGCSDYDNADVSDLVGPANDVVLMRQLLVDFYNFNHNQIQTLANAEPEDRQPTRANILAALEDLIDQATQGDQIAVHFSGHGTQQPDHDFDPNTDPEPDGLDEVFVPTDAGGWDPAQGTLVNAIIDDEFRGLIERLTKKGADVWTIFDCCCSGTIGRTINEPDNRKREVKREVLPGDLNIPDGVLTQARARAQQAYANARIVARPDSLDAVRGASSEGGFVATYAARPFEPTVEMYLPLDALYAADQTSYGLLTYGIYTILSQAKNNLTYTELQNRLQQQYGVWDRAYPICLVEGSRRDELILSEDGAERVTRILLEKDEDGSLVVNAGAVQGLTAGSILRVKPPAGVENAEKSLGCVKVVRVQALKASVEPAEFDSEPPADPAALEPGCRAEIAFLDYGLRKKRLAFASDEASALAAKSIGPALANRRASGMFELTENPHQVDWVVRVSGGKAYLHRAGSLEIDRAGGEGGPPTLDAFGPAPSGGASLAEWITSRMQRIARAEGLLGMSNSNESLMGGEDPVRVNVQLIKYPSETSRGEAVRGDATFKPGDWIGFRVENYGRDSVDVTILYVDSGYGITSIFPESKTPFNNVVDPGTEYTTETKQITSDTFGLERVVVIAVKSGPKPVEFSWLEQETIEQAAQERGGAEHALNQLFEAAAYNPDGVRGIKKSESQAVAIRSVSLTVTE